MVTFSSTFARGIGDTSSVDSTEQIARDDWTPQTQKSQEPDETTPDESHRYRETLADEKQDEHRIARLEERVLLLERELMQRAQATNRKRQERDPRIADVLSVTQEMFPGRSIAELDHDPEAPERPFVVITVAWDGSPKEIVQKRMEWHARISELASGSSGPLRLSIVPE